MNGRDLEELDQIVASIHPAWRITAAFDPREDWGRGMWVSTVTEPMGTSGTEFVVARAKHKLPLTAAVYAIEDAITKAGGARFVG